jgi:SAM-dependent methyltransferase
MDDQRRWAEFTHAQRSAGDRDDVPFYVERAGAADGPVLELGCGTGRVYLELLAAGVDADGLDLSEPALDVLREQAADAGLEPNVWRGNMTAIDADRAYGLVTCPFNTIQQLLTPDDQLAMLRSVHDALAPGGAFVFDVFVPDFEFICGTYGEWQTATVDFRGEPHEYRTRAQVVDQVRQVVDVEEAVEGPAIETTGGHRMTLLPPDQVEGLARLSPFDDWQVTGDYTDEQLADGHRVQVWELEKA